MEDSLYNRKYNVRDDFALMETTIYVGSYKTMENGEKKWLPLSICENDIKIYKILNGEFRGTEIKKLTKEARQYEHGSIEYNTIKEKLPGWTWTGTVDFDNDENRLQRTFNNISLNGTICIEFDDLLDYNVDELIDKVIKTFDHCIYAGKTLSNKLFCIHRANRYLTKSNYIAFFKDLYVQYYMKFGIRADEQCSDITRMRYICYQAGGKFNLAYNDFSFRPDINKLYDKCRGRYKSIINKLYPKKPNPWTLSGVYWDKKTGTLKEIKYDAEKTKELTHNRIIEMLENGYSMDYIDSTNKYGLWYYIACEFKNFRDGEELFIKFSKNSTNYFDSIETIKEKFRNAKVSDINDTCKKWNGIYKKWKQNKSTSTNINKLNINYYEKSYK